MADQHNDNNQKNKKNYENLGEFISETVEHVLNEARIGLKKGEYQYKKAVKASQFQKRSQSSSVKPKEAVRVPIAKNPKGSFSGPLYLAGAFLTGAVGVMCLLTGFTLFRSLISLGFITVSACFITKSVLIKKQLERFNRYVRVINGRTYADIKELAEAVHKSPKYVVRDLTNMIDKEMFPQGQLTEDKKTLLLSDEAAQAYRQMIESQVLRQKEEKERQEMEEANPIYKEINAVLDEGNKAIEEIRNVRNTLTSGDVIQKLNDLESVLEKIFEFMRDNPDALSDIRRFMGYYLPTTLKLIRTYQELDAQTLQVPNIINAKTEIETHLDTINIAFEKLYDDLYQETAMDISSDISVMKHLFEQEGLTKGASIEECDMKN